MFSDGPQETTQEGEEDQGGTGHMTLGGGHIVCGVLSHMTFVCVLCWSHDFRVCVVLVT